MHLLQGVYDKSCIKLSFLTVIPALVHHETDLAPFTVTDPASRFMAVAADPCVDVVAFDFTPKVAGECEEPDQKGACAQSKALLSARATRCFSTESAHLAIFLRGGESPLLDFDII